VPKDDDGFGYVQLSHQVNDKVIQLVLLLLFKEDLLLFKEEDE